MTLRAVAFAILILVGSACGAPESQGRPAALPDDLLQLTTGLEQVYGHTPAHGAKEWYTTADDAAWFVYDTDESCVMSVSRYDEASAPVALMDLSRDELLGGISCTTAENFNGEGAVIVDETPQRVLISMLLPDTYWQNEWTADADTFPAGFEVLAETPEGLILTAAADVDVSRIAVSINCSCGDRVMSFVVNR